MKNSEYFTDNKGRNALMIASREGDINTVTQLVAKGADVNAKDKDGRNALMFAARLGHTCISRYLIKNGADINAKDNLDGNPLLYAYYSEESSIIRLITKAMIQNNSPKLIHLNLNEEVFTYQIDNVAEALKFNSNITSVRFSKDCNRKEMQNISREVKLNNENKVLTTILLKLSSHLIEHNMPFGARLQPDADNKHEISQNGTTKLIAALPRELVDHHIIPELAKKDPEHGLTGLKSLIAMALSSDESPRHTLHNLITLLSFEEFRKAIKYSPFISKILSSLKLSEKDHADGLEYDYGNNQGIKKITSKILHTLGFSNQNHTIAISEINFFHLKSQLMGSRELQNSKNAEDNSTELVGLDNNSIEDYES